MLRKMILARNWPYGAVGQLESHQGRAWKYRGRVHRDPCPEWHQQLVCRSKMSPEPQTPHQESGECIRLRVDGHRQARLEFWPYLFLVRVPAVKSRALHVRLLAGYGCLATVT